MKKILIYFIIILATLTSSLFAQSNMRVQGIVVNAKAEAIDNASIIYNSYMVATTDIDGKFSCLLPRDAELLVFHKDYNKLKVNLDGRQELELILQEQNMEIAVVTVTANTTDIQTIVIDDSDIEIKGNHFHLKTKFRIPEHLFSTDRRYIVQPTIYNATLKERTNLAPVVIDGDKYSMNLYRQLNFDFDNDSLRRFVVENNLEQTQNIYQYHDSLYIDPKYMDHDYRADCFQVLVGYHPTKDDAQVDTITIARGTKKPLRFLDYSFEPMDLDAHVLSLSDGSTINFNYADLAPEPELELMSDVGSSEVEFEVNKTSINYSNPANKASIDAIVKVLQNIQSDENATLKSISMVGYASPEGSLSRNKELASARTKSMLDIVVNTVDEDILKYTNLTYKGEVQPWGSLIELAKADSNLMLASKISAAIDKYGDNNLTVQRAIVRMPEYRSIIRSKYLPKLRKVDYLIDYSVFRPMTFEETKAMAKNKSGKLSRFDYHTLITNEADSSQMVEYEDAALRDYPNFVWDLNRVLVRLISSDSTNLEIMDAVQGQSMPMPITYNHALMALESENIELADSLIVTVGQYRECNYLKSIILALNGDFAGAYPFISSRGGLNEVLIMLAMDENQASFDLVTKLLASNEYKGNAKAWYVHALAANRLDNLTESISSLSHAFQLDPSLVEIARLDAELMDICSLIIPN